jgi:integrase
MKLRELSEKYLDSVTRLRSKSPLTVQKERYTLDRWLTAYGDREADQITRSDLNEFAMNRGEDVCNRTVNLDILSLHNVLKFGLETGLFSKAPLVTAEWKPLKHKTPRRELIPDDALERLCTVATRLDWKERPEFRNGKMLADYLRLVAYSGCRRQAGISARWSDVDFGKRTIVFHTKFDKDVVVVMNKSLFDHLKAMYASRRDENEWLFPSPDRTSAGHWISPSAVFSAVSRAAGLGTMCLHDLRHAFASRAVMAGIDFMTVAAMLGHSDGGILVSKVYGHLSNEHLRSAAAKMNF